MTKYLPNLSEHLWALGLLSSGISSTTAGALTGQFLMDGIFDLKISRTNRTLITRGIVIIPCYLIMNAINVNKIMNLLNIIQFLQLPFLVIPLLKFVKMSSYIPQDLYPEKKQKVIKVLCLFLQGINYIQILISILDFGPLARLLVVLLLGLYSWYFYTMYQMEIVDLKEEQKALVELHFPTN